MGNLIGLTSRTDAGASWRQKAQEYNDERATCIEKSRLAYQSGDHAKAKEWSEKGKAFGKKMEESNMKAAKAIFDALNKPGKQPPRTYDFHGLYVSEATLKMKEIAAYAKKQKWSDITIIVGRGNHSINGIPKVCIVSLFNYFCNWFTCYVGGFQTYSNSFEIATISRTKIR